MDEVIILEKQRLKIWKVHKTNSRKTKVVGNYRMLSTSQLKTFFISRSNKIVFIFTWSTVLGEFIL